MRRLLSEGTTGVIDGFVSRKSGKSFSAALVLRDGRAEFDFSGGARSPLGVAAPEPPPPPDYGSCPLCGKPLIKGKTAYGCSGWREGCPYRRPFEEQIISDINERKSK